MVEVTCMKLKAKCPNWLLYHIKLILGIGIPELDDRRNVILESYM